MVSYVTDYIQNTAAGYLKTGITAAGTMAGNTVGSVGGLVENTGRSVGQAIVGSIGGVGGYINNYGDGIRGKFAADGPVGGGAAKKVAVKPGAPAVKGALPPGAKKPPAAPVRMGVTPKPPVGGVRAPPKGTTAARAPNGKAMPSAASRPAGGVKPAVGGVARPAAPRPPAVGAAKPPGGKTAVSAASRPKPVLAEPSVSRQSIGGVEVKGGFMPAGALQRPSSTMREDRAVEGDKQIKHEVIGDHMIVKQEPGVREDRAVEEHVAVQIKHEIIDDPVIMKQEDSAEFTSVKLEDAENVARAREVGTAEAFTSVEQVTNDVARAGGVESTREFTSVKEEVTGDLARAGATRGVWGVLSRPPCSTCNKVHFNACNGPERAVKRERVETLTPQSTSEGQEPKRRRRGQAALQRSGLLKSEDTAAIKQEGMQSSTAERSRRIATPVRRHRHNGAARGRYCHGCRCTHPYGTHVPRQHPSNTILQVQEHAVVDEWGDWAPSQTLAAGWESWGGTPQPSQNGAADTNWVASAAQPVQCDDAELHWSAAQQTQRAAEYDWSAAQPAQRGAEVQESSALPQEPEIEIPLAIRQAIDRSEIVPQEELFG
nr:hypothetical protein B0A51_10977 [Rachicladosporium sp. CCFEE 5018]